VAENGYRLRIRFTKRGRLRFLSHLEVMRACERAVRRAGLPYAVSQGFSPRMKISFGPALPVGSSGEREFFDLWLTSYDPADKARDRLAAASAPELAPQEAKYVAEKAASLSSAITRADYDVEVEGVGSEDLRASLGRVIESGTLTATMLADKADVVVDLPIDEALELQKTGRFVVTMSPPRVGYIFLQFPTGGWDKAKPLADVRVRRAIMMAIDRSAIWPIHRSMLA